METNSIIKSEYIKMLNKLNQANRRSNEHTEVYFFIDSYDPQNLKLFSTLSKFQKLLLCEKPSEKHIWRAANYEFYELSKFIAHHMKHKNTHDHLTDYLKSLIFPFS